jgi:hypothetical protein
MSLRAGIVAWPSIQASRRCWGTLRAWARLSGPTSFAARLRRSCFLVSPMPAHCSVACFAALSEIALQPVNFVLLCDALFNKALPFANSSRSIAGAESYSRQDADRWQEGCDAFCWWVLEGSNLWPLPCEGRRSGFPNPRKSTEIHGFHRKRRRSVHYGLVAIRGV